MALFKKKTDFFELLAKQCDAMVRGMQALYDYCTTSDEKFGDDTVGVTNAYGVDVQNLQ